MPLDFITCISQGKGASHTTQGHLGSIKLVGRQKEWDESLGQNLYWESKAGQVNSLGWTGPNNSSMPGVQGLSHLAGTWPWVI